MRTPRWSICHRLPCSRGFLLSTHARPFHVSWSILKFIFEDKIIIPDQMAGMQITLLSLRGKIDADGIKRIKAMFPKTTVYINGKEI